LDQKEANLWLWRWIRGKQKTEKNEVYVWMAVEIKKNIHVIDILFDNSSEWYKKWVKLKLSKKVQMR
jgi:hypothetical protein